MARIVATTWRVPRVAAPRAPGRSSGRTARAPGSPRRSWGRRWPRAKPRRARALVPDPDVAVQRVPLHGGLAERLDEVDELVRRGSVGRARGRHDVLLDHHRPEVVGAEPEGDLADLQALRHPRGLDVVDVVEVEAAHRLREQVVEGRRHGVAGDLFAEAVAVVLERPGDERAEAVRLVLELADPAHVLDALGERLDVA